MDKINILLHVEAMQDSTTRTDTVGLSDVRVVIIHHHELMICVTQTSDSSIILSIRIHLFPTYLSVVIGCTRTKMFPKLEFNLVRMKSYHCMVAKYVAWSFRINPRVGLSLGATRNCSRTRAFHTNPPYRRECAEQRGAPVCEECRARPTTKHDSRLVPDRKGIWGYVFTSFCDQCWEERPERKEERIVLRKIRKERRKREKEKKLALRKEKTDKVMEYVIREAGSHR